jgi:hypothetical protein
VARPRRTWDPGPPTGGFRRLLQTPKSVVGRRPGQGVGRLRRQLTEIEIGVFESEGGHLAKCAREIVEETTRGQIVDGFGLPKGRGAGAAEVRLIPIGQPVRPRPDVLYDGLHLDLEGGFLGPR